MDYLAQGSSPPMPIDLEKRRSPRKPMRQRVMIGTVGHGIFQGQTLDISAGGLSVMIPFALATRTVCAVRFELMVDGRLVCFFGNGKVAHCSCAGMEGFRVGMQFQVDDPKLLPSLNKFLAM
jgi:PilZ domain